MNIPPLAAGRGKEKKSEPLLTETDMIAARHEAQITAMADDLDIAVKRLVHQKGEIISLRTRCDSMDKLNRALLGHLERLQKDVDRLNDKHGGDE